MTDIGHLELHNDPTDVNFVIETDTNFHIDESANIHTTHHDYYGHFHDATDDNASLTLGYLHNGTGTECIITTQPF